MDKDKLYSFYKYIQELISGTEFEGHVYLVGGCVRDFLMGNKIKDIDVAVDLISGGIRFAEWLAKKDNCFKQFSNPVCYYNYGTAKLNLKNNADLKDIDIECVQTRKHPSYSPESQTVYLNVGNLIEDSSLRDLTINSIYLDVTSGEIVDPTNGIDDIKDQILSTPTYPDCTFKDDPLRMMRIIRFSSKFEWGIEKETWFGIIRNHKLIKDVSVERFSEELNKILLTNKPSIGLNKIIASGILYDMIPELYSTNHIQDSYPKMFVPNVWEHTLKVVDGVEPILSHRLAALFHDVGKPLTSKILNGTVKFYGHESMSGSIAEKVLKRLKYSNATIEEVKCAIQCHMRFTFSTPTYVPSDKLTRRFLVDIGEHKDIAVDLIKSDFFAHNNGKTFVKINEKIEQLDADSKFSNLSLPINGNDIKALLNIKEGEIIGDLLDTVKQELINNPNLTKEEALKIVYHDYTMLKDIYSY